MSIGAIVAVSTTGATSRFLVGFQPAPQEGAHNWYSKSSQMPIPGEVTGPGEPTTVILLYGHVKLASKHLGLYLQLSVGPSLGQRPCFLQLSVVTIHS